MSTSHDPSPVRRRVFGLALAVLLGAGAVSAYVTLSPIRTWDDPPQYIVDDRGMASIEDGDGGVSATVQAIESPAAWNGAGAGTLVTATAGSVAAFSTGDGVPMLSFDDPYNACNGNCLAATFTLDYEERGDGSHRILDADILANPKPDWTSAAEPGECASEYSIEAVMVHEVGHGLGLDHTSVEGATMYPSTSACDDGGATLSTDDVEGILFLYGGGGPGPGPVCELLQQGDVCTSHSECCSGKCKGAAQTNVRVCS